MNIALFIAKRITSAKNKHGKISRPIVNIAISGIAIGLAVMILTIAIVIGFQKEIKEKVIGFGSHIIITNYDRNTSQEPNPINKNEAFIEEIRRLPDIKHIQSFAVKNGLIKTKTEVEGVLLKGVGSEYNWDFIKANLVSGTVFDGKDTLASKKVVISKFLAARLGLSLNNKLVIYFVSNRQGPGEDGLYEPMKLIRVFTICGIYETGFEEYDKNTVFVDIAQIRKLNFWNKDQVSGLEIQLDKFNNIDKIGEDINGLIGHEMKALTIKQTNATIFSWLDLQDLNAIIIICLMLFVACINMISALLILILERTNMIGLLKALGSNNFTIQKIFLYNAAYLITCGLIVGNIVGIGLCYLQQHFGLFTLNKETYYVSVVPVYINYTYILLLNAGTLLTCMLMLIIPSLIVSKITPVKAIRFS